MTSKRRSFSLWAALLVFCTGIVSLPAQANTVKQTLSRSLAVPAGTTVSVENLVGRMDVSQGGSQLEVTATVVAGGDDQADAEALAKTIKLTVKNDANHISVHVDYPVEEHDRYNYTPANYGDADAHDNCLFGIFCGNSRSSLSYQGERVRVYQGNHEGVPLYVDVQVKLPAGVNADLTNHIGFIKVLDIKNNLGLHSDSGDMQANQMTGNLNLDTGSGDIGLADLHGAVVVRTGSGDVKVSRLNGNLNIHTGSGDIMGGDLQGPMLETDTGSGDVTLDKLAGTLNIRAGSGDIHLEDVQARGEARIGTGSGDITLAGDLSGMTDFNLNAGSGDITLITDHPPAVHLAITTSSGDIYMHWSGVNNVASSDDSFSGDIGAAKGTGRIDTGSGDVTLKQ